MTGEKAGIGALSLCLAEGQNLATNWPRGKGTASRLRARKRPVRKNDFLEPSGLAQVDMRFGGLIPEQCVEVLEQLRQRTLDDPPYNPVLHCVVTVGKNISK